MIVGSIIADVIYIGYHLKCNNYRLCAVVVWEQEYAFVVDRVVLVHILFLLLNDTDGEQMHVSQVIADG